MIGRRTEGSELMARIVVMPNARNVRHPSALADEVPVLLDEHVEAAELCTERAAEQLIERLGWAISDAEEVRARRGR
jgi:hypothetical protein